ncbi:GLPGLI family protein [Flavobacterium sp.]|uniref:GLPGLI family protein n=1 Tax=Flavobacterium sp. TaxID=239 RepID=UPI0037536FD2
MKKYFIFIFTLINFSVNSQIKSGIVNYQVVATENKNSELEKLMLSINPNYLTICKEFEFALTFNSIEAIFKKTDKLYSDESASSIGILKVGFNGNLIQKMDTVFQEISLDRLGNFIQKKKLLKKWNITIENKDIDGYKCYKATAEVIVINPKGTFKHPVIAWFCPAIPFSYGPNGFGGLPGLILELQTKDAVYGVNKIKLNIDDIKIDKLKNYKIVTEEQLNNMVLDLHE